jgi:CubicO group peptidase (beta-lactamase class C family)
MNNKRETRGNSNKHARPLMQFNVASACQRLLLVIFILLTGHAFAQRAPDFAEIDGYVSSQLKTLNIPGAALAIVQGDRLVHQQGYGVSDVSGRPVTPQTPFIIGSTGKSMIALAIMQLVEAGKIELDAPVQRYLPWFGVTDPGASAQITVRHLLNHTSGFPGVAGLKLLGDGDTDISALERHVRALAKVHLSAPVGERFQYSNANYTTLGMIIQTVSGQSYEAYVQANIFEPLDMRRSFTAKAEALPYGLATGYRYWFGQPVAFPNLPFVRGELPAGFHISTAEDMAHYLIAQLNGGRYQDRLVLSSSGIAELHQPAIEGRPGEYYAMGWRVAELDGEPIVAHSGAVPTFMSNMILLPEKGWGIVMLMNASDTLSVGRIMSIGDNVARMLLGHATIEAPVSRMSWTMLTILSVIALAQVVGVFGTARSFRRWQARPQRAAQKLRVLGLPLILNLALAALLLFGLSTLFQAPLPSIRLFQPDIGWIATLSGYFALAWALLRTGMAFLLLQGVPSSPRPAPAVDSGT